MWQICQRMEKEKKEKGIGQLWGERCPGLVRFYCPLKKKKKRWSEHPFCLDWLLCLCSHLSTLSSHPSSSLGCWRPAKPLLSYSVLIGSLDSCCDVTCGGEGVKGTLSDLISHARFVVKTPASANYTLITLARAQRAVWCRVVNVRRRSCPATPPPPGPRAHKPPSPQSQALFCLVTLLLASSLNLNSPIKAAVKWKNWTQFSFLCFFGLLLLFMCICQHFLTASPSVRASYESAATPAILTLCNIWKCRGNEGDGAIPVIQCAHPHGLTRLRGVHVLMKK